MMTRTLPLALVLATLFSTGCGGHDPVSPTQFATSASPSLTVTPSPLAADATSLGLCSGTSSFLVPFHLIVRSDVALVVTDVAMRFVDTRGVTQPQVTLPAPIPITQFGSALADAKAQDFAVSLPIGCGLGRSGTVTIVVGTRDHTGRTFSTQLTAAVR